MRRLACILLVLLSAAWHPQDSDAQDTRVLLAALRQHVNSIRSLDVEYRLQSELKPIANELEMEIPKEARYTWSFVDATEALYEHLAPNEALRQHWVFDGRRLSVFSHGTAPPFPVERLSVYPHLREGVTVSTIYARLIGRRTPFSSRSLAELVQDAQVQHVEPREVAGRLCPTLAWGVAHKDRATLKIRVSLHPDHGWAPVYLSYRVEYPPGARNPQIVPMTEIQFGELSRFNGATASTEVWLPRSAKIDAVFNVNRLDVISLHVNTAPPPARFNTTVPDGTSVYEFGGVPGAPVREYVSGGPMAAQAKLDQIRNEVVQEWNKLESKGVRYDADPHAGLSFTTWFLSAGAVLSLVALIIYAGRRRAAR